MKQLSRAPLPEEALSRHPEGARIQIGDRFFERLGYGSFWREEHEIHGNCVSRPSASLAVLEQQLGVKHRVLTASKTFGEDWPKVLDDLTPGVWICETPEEGGRVLVDDPRKTIVHAPSSSPQNPSAIADAALIAQAKPMLKALMVLTHHAELAAQGRDVRWAAIFAQVSPDIEAIKAALHCAGKDSLKAKQGLKP